MTPSGRGGKMHKKTRSVPSSPPIDGKSLMEQTVPRSSDSFYPGVLRASCCHPPSKPSIFTLSRTLNLLPPFFSPWSPRRCCGCRLPSDLTPNSSLCPWTIEVFHFPSFKRLLAVVLTTQKFQREKNFHERNV